MTNFEDSSHFTRWFTSSLMTQRPFSENCDSFLSAHEEAVLFHLSQQMLIMFGLKPNTKARIKRSWRVAATAIVFFRRFFANKRSKQHDPRLMMICCIFLAGKAEENFISIEELLMLMPKFRSADVIRKEAELLEALGFDLRVYHPQNIIHSLLADWKVYHIKNSSVNADQKLHLSSLVKLWARYSEYLLHEILTTQACLQFTPLELSLHVLAYTAADLMFEECQSSFGQYVFERCGKSQSQRLHTSYDHLVAFLSQATNEYNVEDTKELMRRNVDIF